MGLEFNNEDVESILVDYHEALERIKNLGDDAISFLALTGMQKGLDHLYENRNINNFQYKSVINKMASVMKYLEEGSE